LKEFDVKYRNSFRLQREQSGAKPVLILLDKEESGSVLKEILIDALPADEIANIIRYYHLELSEAELQEIRQRQEDARKQLQEKRKQDRMKLVSS